MRAASLPPPGRTRATRPPPRRRRRKPTYHSRPPAGRLIAICLLHGAVSGGAAACASLSPSQYCAAASDTSPRDVDAGYFSVVSLAQAHVYVTPPGDSLDAVETALDASRRVDGPARRGGQRPCPPGAACVGGVARLCEPGTWTSVWAQADPACQGVCAAGFYCPAGSTSPAPPQRACGNASVYCPAGAAAPRSVTGTSLTRAVRAHRVRQSHTAAGPFARWAF